MSSDPTKSKSPPALAERSSLGIGQRIFKFFCSFGLCVTVLFFLFIITLVGTLSQVDIGLWASQQKYFNSIIALHEIPLGSPVEVVEGELATMDTPVKKQPSITIPLPGGYLLMIVLFFNLVCGAIVNARKNWRTPGMLIAHFSIIFLIFAGFVSYHWKREGNMALNPNERSAEFQSYHNWVIEIEELAEDESAPRKALIIDDSQFKDLTKDGEERTFKHSSLPFDLVLSQFTKNSEPVRVGPQEEAKNPDGSIGGFRLRELEPEDANEANMAGIVATLRGGSGASGILWGRTPFSWVVEAADRQFGIRLKKRTYNLPFALRLDKFTHEVHPGTNKAKVFLSDVTKFEDKREEKIKITMNEPLRHQGYTFFQSSYGPPDARPGDTLYSVFTVVENPSDMWPLWSCVLSAIGLGIHFVQKLMKHLQRAAKKREQGDQLIAGASKA